MRYPSPSFFKKMRYPTEIYLDLEVSKCNLTYWQAYKKPSPQKSKNWNKDMKKKGKKKRLRTTSISRLQAMKRKQEVLQPTINEGTAVSFPKQPPAKCKNISKYTARWWTSHMANGIYLHWSIFLCCRAKGYVNNSSCQEEKEKALSK